VFVEKIVNSAEAIADHDVVKGTASASGEPWPEDIADLLLEVVDGKRILGGKVTAVETGGGPAECL
jgi:hypothetical protein